MQGPIGYGPLVRLAAWLGWTQCDTQKVRSPATVLEWLEQFAADPEAAEDGSADAAETCGDAGDDEEETTWEEIDEHEQQPDDERQKRLARKIMRMFGAPGS